MIRDDLDGPDQWLKNFEKFIFDPEAGGGKTKADNCAIIGQEECEPGHQLTCAEHFNNVNSSHAVGLWPKAAYWIFTAAQEVQLKLSRLDEALGREALITGLKIDQMVDDFDGDAEDSTDAFKWISAAFGLAGTVSGLIPGVSNSQRVHAHFRSCLTDHVTKYRPEELRLGLAAASSRRS